jgi:hypothetical protein
MSSSTDQSLSNPRALKMVGSPKAGTTAWLVGIALSVILTVIIVLLAPFLARFEDYLLPDEGASWYFWKLPPLPVLPGTPAYSIIAQIITWSMYGAHQVVNWVLIWYGLTHIKKWTNGLYKFNLIFLVVNLGFIVLHIVQTHWLYDGLAADVPVWTSQGSVILMLSFMLIIDNPRRGFIFGKKINFRKDVVEALRKYHGYYFAWAFVYTFWFHPATAAVAHILGFFYMFLLMLQCSLMYVKIHLNKYWTTFLESFVMIHGATVAYFTQNSPMWVMFFLGFLGMIVFTYSYGLGLNRIGKILVFIAYIGAIVLIYAPFGLNRPATYLARMEMLWIPIILYLVAFLLYYIGVLVAKIRSKKSSSV